MGQNLRDKIKKYFSQIDIQDHPPFPGQTNHIKASILVPLLFEREIFCILTKRSEGLTKHPGEISFPGGLPDPEDLNLEHTALREANEELGIQQATLLGRLPSVPLFTSNYRLYPFIAEIQTQTFSLNLNEVSKVLKIPIEQTLKHGTVGGIEWSRGNRIYTSPIFEIDNEIIYGGTARVLFELLEHFASILDTQPPTIDASTQALERFKRWKSK